MLFTSVAIFSVMATAITASPTKLEARNDATTNIFSLRQADIDIDSVTNFNSQYAAGNRAGGQAWLTLNRVSNDLQSTNNTVHQPPNLDVTGCNQVLTYLEGPFAPDVAAMVDGLISKKSLYTQDGYKPVIASELSRSREFANTILNWICFRQCTSTPSRCLAVRKSILDDLQAGIDSFST